MEGEDVAFYATENGLTLDTFFILPPKVENVAHSHLHRDQSQFGRSPWKHGIKNRLLFIKAS
jgi:hypothetical protein